MKTLNDLFLLEGMKDCTVLAGHHGLSRPVQSVNISDTPDVIRFLDRNYLLLTTAYPFKNNSKKMCALIKQMHALHCTGIVIKVDRFLKKLPESVKNVADELAFPIIDLPSSHTLGDLSRHILNYLNDHEAEQLYYALHVQKEFSNKMFKGYSLSSLVDQLGRFLSRQAILVNHRGELIARTNGFWKDSMQIAEQEILQTVKEDLVCARQGTTFNLRSKDNLPVTTYPIQTKREHPSILLIIDALTLPYPSSQMAIEQAGNVISFTIVKEQAIEENSRLLKNNFFADLIDGRVQSNQEILSRANYYGLNKNMDTICIVCTVDAQGENYEALQLYEKKIGELHHTIYDQLEDEIMNAKMAAILFTKETYFVMLLQFSSYTETEMNRILAFVENAQGNMEGNFPISFGISNPVHVLSDVSTSYHEAVEAITNGYNLKKVGFIHFYKAKEFEELLQTIPRKDLKALYENTLKSLSYPTTKEELELVNTIETYLDCQCNISETSRKLYVHRNTVKYRIKKAEELLNRSCRDPLDSLQIRVALVIGSLFNANK